MRNWFFLLTIIATFYSSSIFAKKFTSQYCEFELPNGWQCALEGTEWVCQSDNKERRREAIIILAAKVRGKQDSLDQYQAYLKETKTFRLPGGKTQVSDPKYAKVTNVNNHRWIDSLHLASEVPGFYTRYLATVKADLGVAVTFSVAKDHYDSYKGIFDSVVRTLKVFRQAGSANAANFKLKKEDENLLDGREFIPDFDKGPDIGYQQKKKKGSGGSAGDDLFLYLILGVVAAFIFLRMKKKKGASTSKKKKKRKKKK